MKKRTLKSKLAIRKNVISSFQAEAAKGGTNYTFINCPQTQNGLCTFPFQTCLSEGAGCSLWQVC